MDHDLIHVNRFISAGDIKEKEISGTRAQSVLWKGIVLMQIQIRIRILSHVLRTHVGKSNEKKKTYIHISAGLHCLIFLVYVIGDITFNNLNRILKFSGKSIRYGS
jgi:hypothetical protein